MQIHPATTRFLTLSALFLTGLHCGMVACGGSNAQLSLPDTTPCGDRSVEASDVFSASVDGDLCNAPLVEASGSDLALDCSPADEVRNTDDSTVDFATLVCGSGEDADSVNFYCDSGSVIEETDSGLTDHGTDVTATCSTDDGDNILTAISP